jgi:ubiquinone/menaquinone biosynthesis C-methylase UbiE
LRDKIVKENIKNVRVLDGYVTQLPFPDNLFDIVMSGHVVGDEINAEIAELERVCKPGGWLIDCVGDSERDINTRHELLERGWEEIRYIGSFGKVVCNYRKQLDC